jgi:protein involved in polysaccharide export with SLBB domain
MSRRRGWPLLVLGLVFLTVAAGCAGRQRSEAVDVARATDAPPAAASSPEYRFRVGDTIEVRFISAPRYNYETVVTAGGTITIPSGGEAVAAGRTPTELREDVAGMMSQLLLDPTPSIMLKKPGEQSIYVIGEVAGPGRVKTITDMTLTMALAATGGIKSTGKPNSVMVVRTYGVSEPIALKADVSKVFSGEDLSQDILLSPNDVVYVPKSLIGKVDDFVEMFFNKIAPAQLFYLRGYDIMNLDGAEWRY